MRRRIDTQRGLTLVELLIVLAITGIVAAAILSLLFTTQRTASTSEEVVEVQQSLRMTMDLITRDLRMAGFMTPRNETPFAAAQGQRLTVRTGSAEGRAARVSQNIQLTAASDVTFKVATARMANLFVEGENVRILRPPNQSPPVGAVLKVEEVDPANREVTLSGLGSFTGEIMAGDMIVHSSLNDINTVTYCLDTGGFSAGCGQTGDAPCPPGRICIRRLTNPTASATEGRTSEIVATQIAPGGLQFTYFDEDGAATSELDEIRAVRVEITGRTVDTASLGQPKVRSLSSYVRLRNR